MLPGDTGEWSEDVLGHVKLLSALFPARSFFGAELQSSYQEFTADVQQRCAEWCIFLGLVLFSYLMNVFPSGTRLLHV